MCYCLAWINGEANTFLIKQIRKNRQNLQNLQKMEKEKKQKQGDALV